MNKVNHSSKEYTATIMLVLALFCVLLTIHNIGGSNSGHTFINEIMKSEIMLEVNAFLGECRKTIILQVENTEQQVSPFHSNTVKLEIGMQIKPSKQNSNGKTTT